MNQFEKRIQKLEERASGNQYEDWTDEELVERIEELGDAIRSDCVARLETDNMTDPQRDVLERYIDHVDGFGAFKDIWAPGSSGAIEKSAKEAIELLSRYDEVFAA